LALRFRDDDERAISARVGNQCEPNAGIAGGGFDDQTTGPQFAAFLCFQDHLPAWAVLDRTARVHEFPLAENGASGRFGSALELDQWRMADRVNGAVTDLHARFQAC